MDSYERHESDENNRVFSDFADMMIDGGASSSSMSDRNNLPLYNWQPITEDFLAACKGIRTVAFQFSLHEHIYIVGLGGDLVTIPKGFRSHDRPSMI